MSSEKQDLALKEEPNPTHCLHSPAGRGSTAASALGTLSVLPRELRDEIFRLLAPDKISISWYWHTKDGFNYMEENVRHAIGRYSSVLQISKSIREEALQVLYTHGTVSFNAHLVLHTRNPSYDSIGLRDTLDGWATPTFSPLKRLVSNVEFTFDIRDALLKRPYYKFCREAELDASLFIEDDKGAFIPMYWKLKSLASLPAGPVSLFAGAEVMRNSLTFKLTNYVVGWNDDFLESPFILAISQLTGFRDVTILLEKEGKDGFWVPKPVNQSRYLAVASAISSKFVQTLGPSTVGDCVERKVVISDHDEHTVFNLEISFHPQDFQAHQRPNAPITQEDTVVPEFSTLSCD